MTFLHILEGARAPVWNSLMMLISYVGTPFFILGIMEWFYLNVNKKTACMMFISFHLTSLLCQGTKIIVHEPRPWIRDNTFHPVEAALSSASGYSFPSVHTASTSVYGISRTMSKKKFTVRAAALILLVAFSRMYLGCHTPMDVLFGFLFACAITVPVFLLGSKKSSVKSEGGFLFFLIAFAGLLLFLASFLILNNEIDLTNSADCFSAAGSAIGFAAGTAGERSRLHFQCSSGSGAQKLLRFIIAAGGGAAIWLVTKHLIVTSSVPGLFLTALSFFLVTLWMTYLAPLLSIHLNILSPGEITT